MVRKVVALVALVAVSVAASTSVAAAAHRKIAEHCVVHVLGSGPDGEMMLSDPSCYATFDQAMSAEGVDAWGTDAASRAGGVAAATFTIGTHFDGAGYTGASMSVVGSNCAGGWLNVSAAWDNRISSTLNGCPRIRHYSGANLTGSYQQTFSPGGNLTTLNNLTTSIQYLT